MNHWLLKTEPGCFSIEDLAAAPNQTTPWDGVRNYQARNLMRAMRVGDRALFYHSVRNPAVVATVVVAREAYPDHTQFDPASDHYDPGSRPDDPRWSMVDVRLERVFPRPVPLAELRAVPELAGMELLRRGSRLSVQPVSAQQFRIIEALAGDPVVGAPSQPRRRP